MGVLESLVHYYADAICEGCKASKPDAPRGLILSTKAMELFVKLLSLIACFDEVPVGMCCPPIA